MTGHGKGRRPLLALVSLVAVLAIAATGCGSSGNSITSSSGGTHVTKASFAKEINAICGRANASTDALGSAKTMAQVASIAPKIVTAAQSLIDQVGTLQPPAAIKPHVTRFIGLAKEEINLLNPVISAAKNNDAAAFQKAAAALSLQQQSLGAAAAFEAKAMGAPACATG
jgi:hypothetical protein